MDRANPGLFAEHTGNSGTTQNAHEGLILSMQAFTFTVLCASLIQADARSLHLTDFAVCLLCGALQYLRQPVLSLSLAVGHLAWILLPTSHLDAEDLPSHSDFMRNLQILPRQEEPEECMICWDTEHPIAALPCGHRGCTQCLQSMGPVQTACPMCRKPLYRGHDRMVLALSKAGNAIMAVNVVLNVFQAILQVQTSQYFGALCSLALFTFTGWVVWGALDAIRHIGPNWWRIPPGRKHMNQVFLSFGLGFGVFCQHMWQWSDALK